MLAVIAAMRNEAETLLSQAHPLRKSTLCGKPVFEGSAFGAPFALILAGIGKANAAAAAMLAVSALKADALLNFGLAGALSPQTEIASIFRITRAVQYDFDLSEVNGTPVGTLDEYDTPYVPLADGESAFPKGTLATGDRFSDSLADLPLLHALGADVRDMEGAAVAHVASFSGVPLYAYKAVSDRVGTGSVHEYEQRRDQALHALAAKMHIFFEETSNGKRV